MVAAILFVARTGCQWRYLPEGYPPREAVWQQWRRWRGNGVWSRAMVRVAHLVRSRAKRRNAEPTVVMIDAQTERGGRAGPTFHNARGRGGRTVGARRSILVEHLGLPLAVRVDPARPHDVKVGRETITLVGEGGYAGSTAVDEVVLEGAVWDLHGFILEGDMPPAPGLAEG